MDFLQQLNIKEENAGTSTGLKSIDGSGEKIESWSPVDGKFIGSVLATSESGYQETLQVAQEAFLEWRKVPAPRRGEIVRQFGDALRTCKEPLGKLVSY